MFLNVYDVSCPAVDRHREIKLFMILLFCNSNILKEIKRKMGKAMGLLNKANKSKKTKVN